jgi:NAD(P)-dependent dehydrogenase (short-subunit alcohol dehydrogenase family)
MAPPEVVVITGASAGVGRATARAFARRGARIGLIARGVDGLEATRKDVEELGGCGVGVDLRSIGFDDLAPVGLLQIKGDVVFAPCLREHLEITGRRVLRRLVAHDGQPWDAIDPLVRRHPR